MLAEAITDKPVLLAVFGEAINTKTAVVAKYAEATCGNPTEVTKVGGSLGHAGAGHLHFLQEFGPTGGIWHYPRRYPRSLLALSQAMSSLVMVKRWCGHMEAAF